MNYKFDIYYISKQFTFQTKNIISKIQKYTFLKLIFRIDSKLKNVVHIYSCVTFVSQNVRNWYS